MTTKEMKDAVYNHCIDIILKSEPSQWEQFFSEHKYVKDNIEIEHKCSDKFRFKIQIYADKQLNFCRKEFFIDRKSYFLFLWDIKERIIRGKLKKKSKDIDNFFKNKEEYNNALELYNLLPEIPIKELRRKKLKSIQNKKFFK